MEKVTFHASVNLVGAEWEENMEFEDGEWSGMSEETKELWVKEWAYQQMEPEWYYELEQ